MINLVVEKSAHFFLFLRAVPERQNLRDSLYTEAPGIWNRSEYLGKMLKFFEIYSEYVLYDTWKG